MVMSLIICGSGSLPREDDDDELRSIQSAGSSPRKSSSSPFSARKCKTHNHHNQNKNPYATRGLDKFSALLSEIDEKKRTIYSNNNPDEICLVQFDYSKNNHCKPIVVKVKPSRAEKVEIIQETSITNQHENITTEEHHHHHHHLHQHDNYKKSLLRRLKLQKLGKPSCYMPIMVILILIFLALFGRSVAILCTSIGWYAIPIISRRKLNSRRSLEKKGSMVVGHQRRG